LETHRQREAQAEQRFRDLLDLSPVMIWMADAEAMCTFFNRAWLEFRGRAMDQETGNGWTEGLHPDDRDICLEGYLKAFTARQAFRMQYRVQRASGEFCWVEGSGMPRTEHDRFLGFIGTMADVSDRRRHYYTPDEESMRMVFALTERERQVLVLIAEGNSTKKASEKLGISYKTASKPRLACLHRQRPPGTGSEPSRYADASAKRAASASPGAHARSAHRGLR
jgi:PAS domain S-box-containing protein